MINKIELIFIHQGLAGVVVFLSKSHYVMDRLSLWLPSSKTVLSEPCTSLQEELVWEVNLPHAISQGQNVVTSLDMNNDTIEDIIIGYDSGFYMSYKHKVIHYPIQA